MGEIKHGFTAGKMNKDLDERLVPQGQYRDAMNVQIRTTAGDGDSAEGSEAGVIQNLQGNKLVGTATGDTLSTSFANTDFTCVGSIAYEKTDSAYFFFTSDKFLAGDMLLLNEIVKIDTIIEHNVSTGLNTPVVVDRWGLQTPISTDASSDFYFWTAPPTGIITTFNVISTLPAKIREGMEILLYQSNLLTNSVKVKIKKIDGNTIHLYDQINTADATWANFTHARFTHPQALKFSKKRLINGINIIDNLLFWTDGNTEPKKINIDRCKEGTNANGTSHTKLFITNPNIEQLQDAGSLELTNLNSDLLEKHITVLKPAPKTPPTVHAEVRDSAELEFLLDDFFQLGDVDDDGDDEEFNLWTFSGLDELNVGDFRYIGVTSAEDGTEVSYGTTEPPLSDIPFQIGDVFTVKQEDAEVGFTPVIFKVEFIGFVSDGIVVDSPTNLIKVKVVKEPNFQPGNEMNTWSFSLANIEDSKFELKFPRFGYRYKYEDGEYSAFSPWSELAFDPGLFDYDPIKGYNLGMTNTITKLVIKDFIPYYTDRALDITDIEILYKSTESPNIYTIKNIKKIRDGEWELFTPDGALDSNNSTQSSIETGALEIKSEIIYRTMPANQTLRTFDNVPRYALAQEVTGSRILYGNFTQGFDIKYPVGLNQEINSEAINGQPKRSVKTIREYKVGMVFGDIYGRETPVIASNKITTTAGMLGTEYIASTDDLSVPKSLCAMENKISVKQMWDKPGLPIGDPSSMTWMEYVKYYVKETSNEYYNLVLDRWYKARKENNMWLSFPSADRNKVDLETYLYLKKAHGSDEAILDKARYKIIDIQNEAPDFIKTDVRNLGLVNITDNPTDSEANSPIGAADPQINEPFLLTSPTNARIEVPNASWEGFLNFYGENRKGQLYVRVVGRTENPETGAVFNQLTSGDWKKVTHHYVKPNADLNLEVGVVIYEDSFLGSADMVDRFAAAGYTIDGDCAVQCLQYYFEFKEEVVENKPEFDGRFFVLIEKDTTTEEMIEITSSSEVMYNEIDLFTLNYVDSQQFNPAKSGPFSTSVNEGLPDIFGDRGIYGDPDGGGTAFDVGDIDLIDPTQPKEWWGFGRMSQTLPYSDYWNLGTPTTGDYPSGTAGGADNYQYDSRQVNFFALGCSHVAIGSDSPIAICSSCDPDETARAPGAVNYGNVTFDFWATYRRFHRSSGDYSNTDTQGLANKHEVYLDGARANQFHLMEYGTDIYTTDEQGQLAGNNNSYYDTPVVITNDGPAEGIAVDDNGVAIYNYKPTALDQGHAEEGTLGRMVLSRNGGWAANSSNADAGAIYSFFAGDSASGTYFSFKEDKSNMSDPDFPDGKPHVYRVIVEHPDDSGISLPVQKSKPQKSRNFGWMGHAPGGSDLFGFLGYQTGIDQGSQELGCGDASNRTDGFYAYSNLFFQNSPSESGVIFANGYDPDVRFAGENARCIDENGQNPQNCWNGLAEVFDPPAGDWPYGLYDDDAMIRLGMVNTDGGFCNHRFHKICYQCETDGGLFGSGDYDSPNNCARESIRFEFRRVDTTTGLVSNKGIEPFGFDPRGWAKHDGTGQGGITISILQPGVIVGGKEVEIEEDRSVWETEPKEDVGLDLYYEATHALPIKLKEGNTLSYAPLKSKVFVERFNIVTGTTDVINLETGALTGLSYSDIKVGGAEYLEEESIIKVISKNDDISDTVGYDWIDLHNNNIGIGDTIVFEHKSGLQTRSLVEGHYVAPTGGENCTYTPQDSYTVDITHTGSGVITLSSTTGIVNGMNITHPLLPSGLFISWDGTTATLNTFDFFTLSIVPESLTGVTLSNPTGYYWIDKNVYKYEVTLGWHNCYSFGNGVESDRIRDDFNAPQIDNGIKVSTTINEYGREDRLSSLIFSGLYNTTSNVNDLNEFNMGEKILKDLNPEYGSIQALKTRDTDVVAFCEDRILKVQANKEAVFLADNDPQIVATDRVLGTVSTFLGDYGISKSPESLQLDQYRLYFTDSQRGAVLRLSRDGLTPISNVGMKAWFKDNITGAAGYGIQLLGTFDKVNGEYNLSINSEKTISFNEGSKGWVSFKSFIPDQGVSVTGKYLTVKHGTIYQHYEDQFDGDGNVNNRNLFYGAESITFDSQSTLTVMFNDVPGQVKSFKAMNYEGSQARIDQDLNDDEYYNLIPKKGWWVSEIKTDLQDGKIYWFVDKENKWFNKICGIQTTLANLDTAEFTVQGIGSPTIVTLPTEPEDSTTTTTTTTDDGDTIITQDPITYTFTIENNTDND